MRTSRSATVRGRSAASVSFFTALQNPLRFARVRGLNLLLSVMLLKYTRVFVQQTATVRLSQFEVPARMKPCSPAAQFQAIRLSSVKLVERTAPSRMSGFELPATGKGVEVPLCLAHDHAPAMTHQARPPQNRAAIGARFFYGECSA